MAVCALTIESQYFTGHSIEFMVYTRSSLGFIQYVENQVRRQSFFMPKEAIAGTKRTFWK